MSITPLLSLEDVIAATGDDSMLVWAAQGMRAGVRAWQLDDAVAVACPDLSQRDRLAIRGSAVPAAALVRQAFTAVGPGFRPMADTALIAALVAAIPALELVHGFGWMEAHDRPNVDVSRAEWLARRDEPAIDRLLDEAFPTSHARPGRSGVRRWAGVRAGAAGRGGTGSGLIATAADAWSAPGVGLLTGVAVRPEHRGTGAGDAVCGFVLGALVHDHGRAALMVDESNLPAIRLYRRLGMTWRGVAGGKVRG